jgi:ribonuclease J
MHRMAAAAQSVGLFKGLKPFVPDTEAKNYPDDQILFLCTGSQGEARAALSRIAEGTHPHVKLSRGDHCIFSSRVIPGNDIPIRNLQNKLSDRGVRLYTERDHPGIHVSGHPCRDELKEMYAWARPRIAVPTHGERRHLIEHAALARDLQVPEQVSPRNGDMVRLAPGRAEIIDEVKAGRLFLDGGVMTSENSDPLRERRHAAANGVLMVAVALDGKGRLAGDVQVRGVGLPGDEEYSLEDALDDLSKDAAQAIKRLDADARDVDQTVQQAVARVLKKSAQRIWERRPVVETVIVRV